MTADAWECHFKNLYQAKPGDDNILITGLHGNHIYLEFQAKPEYFVQLAHTWEWSLQRNFNRKTIRHLESKVLQTKSCEPSSLCWLVTYFSCVPCFSRAQVSDEWRHCQIIPLYENKSSITDPNKYRGFALLTNLYKLYTNIICRRPYSFVYSLLLTPYKNLNGFILHWLLPSDLPGFTPSRLSNVETVRSRSKMMTPRPLGVPPVENGSTGFVLDSLTWKWSGLERNQTWCGSVIPVWMQTISAQHPQPKLSWLPFLILSLKNLNPIYRTWCQSSLKKPCPTWTKMQSSQCQSDFPPTVTLWVVIRKVITPPIAICYHWLTRNWDNLLQTNRQRYYWSWKHSSTYAPTIGKQHNCYPSPW